MREREKRERDREEECSVSQRKTKRHIPPSQAIRSVPFWTLTINKPAENEELLRI
jgi:hypothetical protein